MESEFFVFVEAMIAHPEKRFYLQNNGNVQFFIIMPDLISFYSVLGDLFL